jgi:ABC-type multidrug transport system fused ATPase/permease subunit
VSLCVFFEKIFGCGQGNGVHDFIMSLPDNYDFDVKERGVMLSSGRQLTAFLRAYVAGNSILILDEAFLRLIHSEELIQRATETITTGRTSIVIATDSQL